MKRDIIFDDPDIRTFFKDYQTVMKKDSAYRKRKSFVGAEAHIQQNTNDDIVELENVFTTFLEVIDESIAETSYSFYDILKDQGDTMISDLYARFIFIFIQTMLTEYKLWCKINAKETREKCTAFLVAKYREHVEEKFVINQDFGIKDFRQSLESLQELIDKSLCNLHTEWDGSICEEEINFFELEIVSRI